MRRNMYLREALRQLEQRDVTVVCDGCERPLDRHGRCSGCERENPTTSHGDSAGPNAKSRLSLTRADTLKPRRIEWLWDGRIPLGMLSLMVGRGERGKSTAMAEVAARLTRGQLKGDLFDSPSTVFIATFEDTWESVTVPRLIAAGADLTRVHFVAVQKDEQIEELTLPEHTADLIADMRERSARLLTLDPLVASMPMSLDSHKDQHVRRTLAPLSRLAGEIDAAVVGIIHLNKSQETDAINRINGSVAFGNSARSVLVAGLDPEDDDRRVLAHGKNNVGPRAVSLRYRIESRDIDFEGEAISTSGIAWKGEAPEVSDQDVLGGSGDEEHSAVREAEKFLRTTLAGGTAISARDVIKEAKGLGVSERTLRRARNNLGVEAIQQKNLDGTVRGWYWSLGHLGHLESDEDETRGQSQTAQAASQAAKVGHLDASEKDPGQAPDSSPQTAQTAQMANEAGP